MLRTSFSWDHGNQSGLLRRSEIPISRRWRALAGASGLLFTFTFILGIGIGGPPPDVDPSATAEAVAAALVDHRANLVAGNYILLLAVFLLVVFAGYLRHVPEVEERDRWAQTVAFGGALVAAAVVAVTALIGIAQGQLEDYGADPVIARTLLTLGWNGVSIVAPGFAALVGATTLLVFHYRYLPRFIGFFGAIVAIALLTPFWGFGLIGALLWLASTSAILTLRELRPVTE